VEPDDSANSEPRTANRENVRPIIDLLDVTPFLPSDVVTLAMWVSEYYACGPGEAIAAAMPPRAWIESERHAQITSAGRAQLAAERGARRELLAALDVVHPVRVETLVGKTARHATLLALERDGLIEITHPLRGHASAYRTARFASLTTHGHDAVDGSLKLGKRQQEALALLKGAPDGLDSSELTGRGITAATIRRLNELGLTTIERRRVERDPFEQGATLPTSLAAPLVLTVEQAAAFDRLTTLSAEGTFRTVL